MLEVRMRMKANKIAVVTALGAVVLNASLLIVACSFLTFSTGAMVADCHGTTVVNLCPVAQYFSIWRNAAAADALLTMLQTTALVLLAFFLSVVYLLSADHRFHLPREATLRVTHDYYRELFADGILHPKIW